MSEPTTMDIATEPNNNGKRARANAQTRSSQRTSALQDARFAASVTLASLPATIKALAEPLLDTFLKLRIELYNLEENKSRLSKADYSPISTRFNFNLSTSTRVLEQANDQYETLSDRCQMDLAVCKDNLKKSISSLVDLEMKVIRDDISKHFCVSIGSLAVACAIATPTIESRFADDLVFLVFDSHYAMLLDYSEITDVQTFFNLFKTATAHPAEPYENSTLCVERARAVSPIENSFKDLIHILFVRTWQTYLATKDQAERDLELQAFVEDRLKRSATEPVAMELDNITADSPALDALISSKISVHEKRMEKMMSRLSMQVKTAIPKNRNASANPNARTKKAGKPKSKSKGPQADAAAKGTGKNKQTKGKKQNKKKNTNSNERATSRS